MSFINNIFPSLLGFPHFKQQLEENNYTLTFDDLGFIYLTHLPLTLVVLSTLPDGFYFSVYLKDYNKITIDTDLVTNSNDLEFSGYSFIVFVKIDNKLFIYPSLIKDSSYKIADKLNTVLTTNNLTEGSLNLYLTNQRLDNKIKYELLKSTDDLLEGTVNLYYDDQKFSCNISIVSLIDDINNLILEYNNQLNQTKSITDFITSKINPNETYSLSLNSLNNKELVAETEITQLCLTA